MKLAIVTIAENANTLPSLIRGITKCLQDVRITPIIFIIEDFKITELPIEFINEIKLKTIDITPIEKINNNKILAGLTDDFIKKLTGVDVVLLYDLLFNQQYFIHNLALKEAQAFLGIKFISFHLEKTPTRNDLNLFFSNITYVFSDKDTKKDYQEVYQLPDSKCFVSPLLNYTNKDVHELFANIDLSNVDYMIITLGTPTPQDLLDKVAGLVGIIKCISFKKVKLIICDNKPDDQKGKNIIKLEGYKNGLELNDILFTSDIGYEDGFPTDALGELLRVSNLFIVANFSKDIVVASMVANEKNNIIAFNEASLELKELGNKLEAYNINLGSPSKTFKINEPTDVIYLTKHAKNILNLLENNSFTNVKKEARFHYSQEFLWKHLEPLLKEISIRESEE